MSSKEKIAIWVWSALLAICLVVMVWNKYYWMLAVACAIMLVASIIEAKDEYHQ